MSKKKRTFDFSLDGLKELEEYLRRAEKNVHEKTRAIAEKVADEMYEEVMNNKYKSIYGGNPYANTKKEVIENGDCNFTARISNTDNKAYFYEFGTGIKGATAMASPYLDIGDKPNKYGASGEGWWYPTDADDDNPTKKLLEDGKWIAWTRGLMPKDGFYHAYKLAEGNIEQIAREELGKD